MQKRRQIFAVAFVVLGILLVLKGVIGGVWPISIQLVAGALLIVVGVLRLRIL
jgi:hypothetical protein